MKENDTHMGTARQKLYCRYYRHILPIFFNRNNRNFALCWNLGPICGKNDSIAVRKKQKNKKIKNNSCYFDFLGYNRDRMITMMWFE